MLSGLPELPVLGRLERPAPPERDLACGRYGASRTEEHGVPRDRRTGVARLSGYRGTHIEQVLNVRINAKAIHPVYHDVVDYKEYKFQTGGILADLMGGEPIPKKNKGSTAPALEAPGEILVFDAEGNLRVRNETDDIEEFRRALVPEPDPKSLPGAAGADQYSSGDAAELSGGSGYPGSSGYPGKGRSPRGSGGRSMSSGP